MKQYLEAGRLGSPRGIKGELRFDCWCDSPEFLAGVKTLYLDPEGKRPLEILSYRTTIPSIVFKGYEDRGIASTLTNRTLWFDRRDIALPDGICFNDDLIGLDVTDSVTGEKYGVLFSIEEVADAEYYVIKGENKSYRVPAVASYIVKKSLSEGIFTTSLEGLEI